MIRRITCCVGLAMLLVSCSYHYDLKVVAQNDQILIEPAGKQGNGCLSILTVEGPDHEIMWGLNSNTYRYGQDPCKSSFPVTYGVAPPGLPERSPPMPLKEGVTYTVYAWDGDSYDGAFRLRRGIVVDNVPIPPDALD